MATIETSIDIEVPNVGGRVKEWEAEISEQRPDRRTGERRGDAAEAVGVVSRRVKADLRRFKAFVEARGRETGAGRGEIRRREEWPRAA